MTSVPPRRARKRRHYILTSGLGLEGSFQYVLREMISKTWQEEIYFLDGENSAQSMLALRVHVEDLGVVPMVMILEQFVESMCQLSSSKD